MKAALFLCIAIFSAVFCACVPTSHAAVAPTLSISPAKFNLVMQPGDLQENDLKITNPSDVSLPIKVEIMDFAPKDASGAISFNTTLPGHSGKGWVHISKSDFILVPKEEKKISFSINPPDSTAPGGYYAVIMLEPQLPSTYFDTQAQASIVPWVGALVLMQVGDIPQVNDDSLVITRFSRPRISGSNRVPFEVEVKNTTRFHIAPEAKFALKSPFGKIVAQSDTVDTTIMPESSRIFKAEVIAPRFGGVYQSLTKLRVAGYEKQAQLGWLSVLTVLGVVFSLMCLSLITGGVHFRQELYRRLRLAYRSLKGFNTK